MTEVYTLKDYINDLKNLVEKQRELLVYQRKEILQLRIINNLYYINMLERTISMQKDRPSGRAGGRTDHAGNKSGRRTAMDV